MRPQSAQDARWQRPHEGKPKGWRIVSDPYFCQGAGYAEVLLPAADVPDGVGDSSVVLRPDETGPRGYFGWSTALHGELAAVSAIGEGAHGCPAGAVYLFRRDQAGPHRWSRVARLTPDVARPGLRFGWSVAVHEDWVLVGAPGDDRAGYEAGAAFLFGPSAIGQRGWMLRARHVAPDGHPFGWFGRAVCLRDGVAMVAGRRHGAVDEEAWATYTFRLPA